MATSMTFDFTDFNKGVLRLVKMGEVKKSEINKIFREASKEQVKAAKGNVTRSKKGSYSLQYAARTHKPGFLKSKIAFKISKLYKHVYYVNSGAWYSMIYSKGHGRFSGNKFMVRAISSTEQNVKNNIRKGLFDLIRREWSRVG